MEFMERKINTYIVCTRLHALWKLPIYATKGHSKNQPCPYLNKYCQHFLLDDINVKTEKYGILQLYTSLNVGVVEYGCYTNSFQILSPQIADCAHKFKKNTIKMFLKNFLDNFFHFLRPHSQANETVLS